MPNFGGGAGGMPDFGGGMPGGMNFEDLGDEGEGAGECMTALLQLLRGLICTELGCHCGALALNPIHVEAVSCSMGLCSGDVKLRGSAGECTAVSGQV